MSDPAKTPSALAAPPLRLSVAVTGHRATHATYAANEPEIRATLARALQALERGGRPKPRLHTLLAPGADLLAAEFAATLGWELVAPLPFGPELNAAVNAEPLSLRDTEAILEGRRPRNAAGARAEAIRTAAARARVFALAEEDDRLIPLYLAAQRSEATAADLAAWRAAASERASLAGRVMIEQSDLLIAIWDGATSGLGGIRHTAHAALESGAPVVWIDARAPSGWRVLESPEALAEVSSLMGGSPEEDLTALASRLLAVEGERSSAPDGAETWRPRSRRRFHAYRRIEVLFGGATWSDRFRSLVQRYETPDAIGQGSGAAVLAAAKALPDADPTLPDRIDAQVLQRFAWADGRSTYLSDAYRGGMVASFLLSALAVIGGVAYLPFDVTWKWPFALFEFLVLVIILLVTFIGTRFKWHDRWFETRREAEYLRHAPILLLLGVARPTGRWPRGTKTNWPEHDAHAVLREFGLPHQTVGRAFLEQALQTLLRPHVMAQRDYHLEKAARLTRAHHNIDRLSEFLFSAAVVSVGGYLIVVGLEAAGFASEGLAHSLAKPFTVFGVLLPTLGGAFAGIRYFGDFERFAAISHVTAEKLDIIGRRIDRLLAAPSGQITFSRVADLAHATDDVVVSEIESWQAVFGGKHITVPV